METCVALILNYNDSQTVETLVKRIQQYPVFQHIVIVDNCSTDDSFVRLKRLETATISVIQTDKNGGYGYGNNVGTRYIKERLKAKYTLLSNPDVVFSNELIEKFIHVLEESPMNAVVSAIQLDITNHPISDQAWRVPTSFEYAMLHSGKLSRFFSTTSLVDYRQPKQLVECVPGALLLYNTDIFLEVGGYDEDMFLFGEETTLGFKLKEKGYQTWLIVEDSYRHEHSVSINKSIQQKSKQLEILYQSRLLFMKKYLKSSQWLIGLTRFLQKRTLDKLR